MTARLLTVAVFIIAISIVGKIVADTGVSSAFAAKHTAEMSEIMNNN